MSEGTEALFLSFKSHVPEQEARIALQVYLELCEIKRYHNVSHTYNPDLKKIVLIGSKQRDGPTSAFVPVTINEDLSFGKIESILKQVEYPLVYLVIIHSDSTCVYYQIANGLVEPSDATAKRHRENKQEALDGALRKNREALEAAALMGTTVKIGTTAEEGKDETVD